MKTYLKLFLITIVLTPTFTQAAEVENPSINEEKIIYFNPEARATQLDAASAVFEAAKPAPEGYLAKSGKCSVVAHTSYADEWGDACVKCGSTMVLVQWCPNVNGGSAYIGTVVASCH